MVFRKRGVIRLNEKWTYADENLESVNDFNYLGTVFNYTGNFSMNQEYLSGKGLKALNTLFAVFMLSKLITVFSESRIRHTIFSP